MKTLKTALSYIPYLLLFYFVGRFVGWASRDVEYVLLYPLIQKSSESLIWTFPLYVVGTAIYWVYCKTMITLPTIILNAHDRFYPYCFGKSISLPSIKPIYAFILVFVVLFYPQAKDYFNNSKSFVDILLNNREFYPLFAIQLWGLKKNANIVVRKLRLY